MGLSKKNLDKLEGLFKNNNLENENSEENKISSSIRNHFNNSSKSPSPNSIFYSLIDNSENLNETAEINYLLRQSEKEYTEFSSSCNEFSNHLTTEDELYDEFNYLLDE